MLKIVRIGQIVTCVILLAIITLSANASTKSLVAEMKLSSKNLGGMGDARLWIKGDSYRWEKSLQNMVITIVKNSDGVFLIHPAKRWAAKYEQGSNRENPASVVMGPFGDIDSYLKEQKARKLATTVLNGRKCVVWTWGNAKTITNKLYVDEKKNVPVKMVIVGNEKKSDTIEIVYKKYELGAKIDDSVFKLPEGIEIRNMPKRGSAKPSVQNNETKENAEEKKTE